MATFAASGLFFLKFFLTTRDRFFFHFATACWLLSAERIVVLFLEKPFPSDTTAMSPENYSIFIFRLLAFLVIVRAIINKNRADSGKAS